MVHMGIHACMGNKLRPLQAFPLNLIAKKQNMHPQMLSNWIYYLHLYRIEYGSNY